jgi:tetratricopeptide (TPR) repeat protein
LSHRSIEVITEHAVRAALRASLADRPRAAICYLEEALEADPHCYEALVMLGEVWDDAEEELGLKEGEGSRRALPYYERAIALQPDNAEAYAEMSGALVHLDQYERALEAANQALALLDQPPVTDHSDDVWVNIAETVYRMRALALLNLNRPAEGRRVLDEGLQRFPESWYLTDATKFFLPGGLNRESS